MTHSRNSMTVSLYVPAKPPLGQVRQLMMVARAMRLESIMVWDHLQDFYPSAIWDDDFTWMAKGTRSPHEWFEFQTLLGYLAGRAGNVRVGVGVTEAVRRHPVIIAQSMVTLAHMTKRAPILGLGSGERENTEPYGLSIERSVSRLEEALQIIRACFGDERFINFHGEHFRLDRAVMDLKAPPGRTPEIWLAAHGPRMLRLAGTYADGWYPALKLPIDEYREKLETVRAAARNAGRDPDAIVPSMQLAVVIAPSEDEAMDALKHPAIRYLGLIVPAQQWRQHGFEHPLGSNFRGYIDLIPEQYTRDEIDEAVRKVPIDMLRQIGVGGTPAQVAATLHEYRDAGCRNVVLMLGGAYVSRKLMMYNVRALWSITHMLRSR